MAQAAATCSMLVSPWPKRASSFSQKQELFLTGYNLKIKPGEEFWMKPILISTSNTCCFSVNSVFAVLLLMAFPVILSVCRELSDSLDYHAYSIRTSHLKMSCSKSQVYSVHEVIPSRTFQMNKDYLLQISSKSTDDTSGARLYMR